MKEIIKVNNLNYSIFHDFNISFSQDVITTISGSNKCGKTLLLRILSRKIIANEDIIINNKHINEYTNNELFNMIGLVSKEDILFKEDSILNELKSIEGKINELTEENKTLTKKNKELVDDNEIMKRIQQEMESKMEKDKMREPSMPSEEVDYDNEASEQKIMKLKNEIEKLKLIENKFKGLEKESEKYKQENDSLKKEIEKNLIH